MHTVTRHRYNRKKLLSNWGSYTILQRKGHLVIIMQHLQLIGIHCDVYIRRKNMYEFKITEYKNDVDDFLSYLKEIFQDAAVSVWLIQVYSIIIMNNDWIKIYYLKNTRRMLIQVLF